MAKTFWLITGDVGRAQILSFGDTAEKAVENAIHVWRDKYAPRMQADPDLIGEAREALVVYPVDLEKQPAFVLMDSDALWLQDGISLDDPRFDGLFDARTRGMKP